MTQHIRLNMDIHSVVVPDEVTVRSTGDIVLED